MDANAVALVHLLIRIGKNNPAFNQRERAFVARIETLADEPEMIVYDDGQMATIRSLAGKVEMPDPPQVWIERIVQFTVELENRGVDSATIGATMASVWG